MLNTKYALDIVLFSDCNLNCLHCFQTHIKNDIDKQYLNNLPQIIHEHLLEKLKTTPNINEITLSLRGGEIFQDRFSENQLEQYLNIFKFVIHNIHKYYPHIKFNLHCMSNGIFTKTNRIIDFLKHNNISISLSYDGYGRFNTNTLSKFKENCLELKPFIKDISITLTKPSVEQYLSSDELLFFTNYNLLLDFNYYIPTKNANDLIISDEILYTFYNYLLEKHIFNCKYLIDLFESLLTNKKIYPSCNCQNTEVLVNGKYYTNCTLNSSLSNIQIKNKALTKRQCLFCENYNNCYGYCWLSILHDKYIISECPHKKLLTQIKTNPIYINNYLKWKTQ